MQATVDVLSLPSHRSPADLSQCGLNLTIPFMYGIHAFTKSAHRSPCAAVQSNKVYLPRMCSRALAGIASRQINAIRWAS